MTLDDAIRAFAEHLQGERRVSRRTLQGYVHDDLAGFARFVRSERSPASGDVRAIEVGLLRRWLSTLSERAPSSIGRKIACLRSWMRWLHARGLVDDIPADKLALPKLRRRLPNVLSVGDAARTMGATISLDGARNSRNRAILELLYGSGLRVSEAVGLDVEALDLQNATVRVRGKGRKERELPLTPPCVAALAEWMGEHRPKWIRDRQIPALFLNDRSTCDRLSVRCVQRIVKDTGRRAGVEKLHAHALRATAATHMVDGGAPLPAVQRLLGHERLGTTQRYLATTTKSLLDAYTAAHPLARPPASAAACDGCSAARRAAVGVSRRRPTSSRGKPPTLPGADNFSLIESLDDAADRLLRHVHHELRALWAIVAAIETPWPANDFAI